MFELMIYFIFIVLSDIVAAKWMIPNCFGINLPYGISAPAGVIFIGAVLTLRDRLHDKYGWKNVIGIVLLASVFAFLIGYFTGGEQLQKVSIASVFAFLFSEIVDTGIYQQYIKLPWLKRVIKSNAVSALVDSVLFIGVVFGFRSWSLMLGQIILKNIIGGLWALGYTVASMKLNGITIQ